MGKLLTLLFAACVTVSLIGCGNQSPKKQAGVYRQRVDAAFEDGDTDRGMEIMEEMIEYMESLPPEERGGFMSEWDDPSFQEWMSQKAQVAVSQKVKGAVAPAIRDLEEATDDLKNAVEE